jgi:uncharacterized protein YdhG (YjbR/CyaY superfamily)
MAGKRPTTIAEYILAAPPEGQPHLRRLRALLRKVAPKAKEAIKWGQPFFVEPRFLFSFNANKAHVNFAPSAATLQHFRKELAAYRTTKNFLQVRYDEPLPEDLIRRLAEHQLQAVTAREDDAFW